MVAGTDADRVMFCTAKCGDMPCNYMLGETTNNFPCVDYICAFCEVAEDKEYCSFCIGDELLRHKPHIEYE